MNDQIDFDSHASGRARAVFFQHQGLDLVLKHYHRGGKVTFLGDRYFGLDPQHSRSFREWQLLYTMRALDLPVPAPVAAAVIRSGVLYRADLVTEKIEQAQTLADLCMLSVLDDDQWQAIGHCLRRFHDHDIYHADLNARNIVIDRNAKVWLVDFDKGRVRSFGDSWKAANLSRLHRSLTKFRNSSSEFCFETDNWNQLLAGYRSSSPSTASV